ncbi:MAG TPA: UrcA family protein [Sphingorhabdus sp.]|jgi:UrcA family protein|nr:UrcA family protein [Sphingorhabdus sp.]
MATPKLFATTLLAAATLAIATPASADWKTKEVGHEDLDLSTAAGQARLKTRVKSAVKQVCGAPRAITLQERIDQKNCEADAMARAMPKAEQRIAAYKNSRQLASADTAVVGN